MVQIKRKDLIVIDTETTGYDRDNCAIIEIAAIHTTWDGEEKSKFVRAVVPFHGCRWDDGALAMHRPRFVSRDVHQLRDAQPLKQVMTDLKGFLLSKPAYYLIAHNGEFDRSFLNNSMARCGGRDLIQRKFDFDTIGFARRLKSEGKLASASLENVCKALGIATPNTHQALGDARLTLAIFPHLLRMSNIEFEPEISGEISV